ncbi:hypothetical protein O2K51_03145 [Apibacter raozihei]|uniref:hypothetical protein n=1 Tax=Apibacter raozihei TaxID=2500547 RepID=UPI000FE38137|nr:hypothetical protein [Apibacter raozihei]
MNDKKLKHLEFIQNTITRMSTNSFIVKGWCVTLLAALFALAAKDANKNYILITYFALLIFWMLNAYFLQLERKFRCLYDKVRLIQNNDNIDFSMNTSEFTKDKNMFYKCFLSKTLIFFYGTQLIISLLIMFYI